MANATSNIRVSCPNCAKVLRLNTRPAKGKKITCPACSEAFAPQTDDDETGIQDKPSVTAKASSNKASRPRPSEDDDDDDAPKKKRRDDDEDDDDDDAPRKKKKKAKKKAGNSLTLVLLLGGGAVLLLCVLVPLGAFGFMLVRAKASDHMSAVAFNNAIAGGNKRLFNEGMAFGKAVGPALRQQQANIVEVRRTHKAMQDTHAGIKAEAQNWKIPPGASAKNLFDSHQRFLKVQEDGIKGFGEVVVVLENPALNAQQKANQIQAIFGRLANSEQAALADLQAKQRTFAAENNIMLMPGG